MNQRQPVNTCQYEAAPQNISLLDNDREEIGKRRVEQPAKAFDVHPAIIMFPDYEAKEIQRAAGE